MISTPVTAISPGKIILSGEHSVAYAQPALALAVNLHATAVLEPLSEPILRLQFAEHPEITTPLADLPPLTDRLESLHAEFIAGRRPIRDVLTNPSDLLLYTIALARPQSGLRVQMELGIPHGSGMGSSAAVILSLLRAALPDLSRDQLLPLALRAEHLQHGRSSGIDLHACLHGGLHYFQAGGAQRKEFPPLPFDLIHTGIPTSSTGECVSSVREHHAESPLWNEFGEVTRATIHALQKADAQAWRQAIRTNHRLLTRIGVVPEPVQTFIQKVEEAGGAAKICGAGSIMGHAGGVVLATGVQNIAMLAARHGYSYLQCGMDSYGTRLR